MALKEGMEVITMGDTNLNYYRWNTPEGDRNSYDKLNHPMSHALQDRIFSQGVKLLNTQPTREKDNPQSQPSCLDQMYKNKPEKILRHQAGIQGFSDHYHTITGEEYKKTDINTKVHKDQIFSKFLPTAI